MAQYIYHQSETRGHDNHGWLDSKKTFSFADYYNPKRMNFGVLRVLNDDTVEGGKGFGSHPHDNMEIISIPLEGSLEHKDNMGNVKVVRQGEVQIMSTGSGIFHSEYNKNTDSPAKFLQIWLYPNRLNAPPRYDQVKVAPEKKPNTLQQVISPDQKGPGTWIYQDAWFSMGNFEQNKEIAYSLQKQGNGVYAFIIKGSFSIDGKELHARDGLGIWATQTIAVKALENDSEILIMDIPMEGPVH
ncbi:pirin family protein [Flavitalea flava]